MEEEKKRINYYKNIQQTQTKTVSHYENLQLSSEYQLGEIANSLSSTNENPSNLRWTLCERSQSSTGVSMGGKEVKSSSKLLVSRG